MNQCVLGIDLGTSSVKIIKKYLNGHVKKYKKSYHEPFPLGWWNSVEDLLKEIDWTDVLAIGLSSQVGTYLINDESVIAWNEEVGKEELKWWKETILQETFLQEISMPHPEIISYPLPRLKYIKEHYKKIEKISQPKEYILEKLTSARVSDVYSWRGLVNLQTGKYSKKFLDMLQIKEDVLPPLKKFDEIAGVTVGYQFEEKEIPEGIPVYVGLNDYYAGLLGMGIRQVGQMFDVTGTSEHLGIIQEEIEVNTTLVAGPYIEHMVHYGVTASSGPSIKFGLNLSQKEGTGVGFMDKFHGNDLDLEYLMEEKPPIFLPYLKGERAPVWNAKARGIFFGIEEVCSKEHMTYATMEGVVFSLYHIYETMGKPPISKITISGGAANIDILNRLKAEVFGTTVEVVEEEDVSALGACMVAAVGAGIYKDYHQIAQEWVKIGQKILSENKYKDWFEKRYVLYKELYRCVEPMFEKWSKI